MPVPDATDLSEITTVPITGSSGIVGQQDVFTMPDGRITANARGDGLRSIDPLTLAVSVGPVLTAGTPRGPCRSPTRASDLVPNMAGVRNRRMIGRVALPGVSALGSADGRLGLATGSTNSIRRLRFDPAFVAPGSRILAPGALVGFPGTSGRSDVIVLGLASRSATVSNPEAPPRRSPRSRRRHAGAGGAGVFAGGEIGNNPGTRRGARHARSVPAERPCAGAARAPARVHGRGRLSR